MRRPRVVGRTAAFGPVGAGAARQDRAARRAPTRRAELAPADVAFSLAATRGRFEQRGVVVGDDRAQILAGLDALAVGEPAPGLHQGRARTTRTAFLFSGQGAQRPGMGSGLAAAFPVFAESLEATTALLGERLGIPLREIIAAPEGSDQNALLDRTEVTQAALFAHEVSLYRLLDSLGLGRTS